MDANERTAILSWLIGEGLAGRREADVLRGFCERCCAAGLHLWRTLVFIDTLHPVFEGHGARWSVDGFFKTDAFDYESTQEGEAAARWERTPFFHMIQHGASELLVTIEPGGPLRFPIMGDWSLDGCTAYLSCIHRFEEDEIIGQVDCAYSYWMTQQPGGFSPADMEDLRVLGPALALALKSAALKRIARTLGHVYLGRDAGERVLNGRIVRGVAERIDAVLWYSDLHGFTSISDSLEPADLIPFLNDYAEAGILAVQQHGGEVLKLLGDGLLAIFTADDPGVAAGSALLAERRYRANVAELNARRRGEGQAATSAYVALHRGEVFYGNIGSRDRLDFTVVGPAVNEASRIAAMCSSVGRDLLVSSSFLEALDDEVRADFVSVGRFALRGVGRAQSLYTLDPALRD